MVLSPPVVHLLTPENAFVFVVLVPKCRSQERILLLRGRLAKLARDRVRIVAAFDLRRGSVRRRRPGWPADDRPLAGLARAAAARGTRQTAGTTARHNRFIGCGTAAATSNGVLLAGNHIVEIAERTIELVITGTARAGRTRPICASAENSLVAGGTTGTTFVAAATTGDARITVTATAVTGLTAAGLTGRFAALTAACFAFAAAAARRQTGVAPTGTRVATGAVGLLAACARRLA